MSRTDAYTLVCQGAKHAGLVEGPDLPRGTSEAFVRTGNVEIDPQLERDREELEPRQAQLRSQSEGQDRTHVLEFCRQHGVRLIKSDASELVGEVRGGAILPRRLVSSFRFLKPGRCNMAYIKVVYGSGESLLP